LNEVLKNVDRKFITYLCYSSTLYSAAAVLCNSTPGTLVLPAVSVCLSVWLLELWLILPPTESDSAYSRLSDVGVRSGLKSGDERNQSRITEVAVPAWAEPSSVII